MADDKGNLKNYMNHNALIYAIVQGLFGIKSKIILIYPESSLKYIL